MNFNQLIKNANAFLESLRERDAWKFRFSSGNQPNLIASSLAAMLGGLTGWVDTLTNEDKKEWASYLNSFQRSDGFFSDKDIQGSNRVPGYTRERALFHRTRHALFALESLGAAPKHPFTFIYDLYHENSLKKWMKNLNLSDYWDASNKIMDLCLFLDYEAKAHKNRDAEKGVHLILDICDENTDPKTGYHDKGESELRNAMAGAMHLYPIYFLYGRKPKYPEAVIRSTLSLQQSDGLFSYEVGTGGEDCLDYDAVNILVNFSHVTSYKREEIKKSLAKVLEAMERCRNNDGGFCCHRRDEHYRFGTFTTEVSIGGSSLWATYSRLLTIAMATKVLQDHPMAGDWKLGTNIMEIWNGGSGRMKEVNDDKRNQSNSGYTGESRLFSATE